MSLLSLTGCRSITGLLRKTIIRQSFQTLSSPGETVSFRTIMTNQRFEVTKSRSDKREYRGLLLPNRMKVLLISDPTTDKSAASLDVHVGSMSDPWEVPGVAHFLEHMLFLGTKKYPEENEYTKFLSNHNGQYNAFTASNDTNYHFDVSPEFLPDVLDRFAQFFISPLFTATATDREMNAVDHENANNFKHDGWKMRLLEQSWGDPTHDYAKFSCGNLETLKTVPEEKGIDVRDQLLKFHAKWYSSNIMSLAVLGKETLDDLETLVTDLFSGIEDKDVTSPTWDVHPFAPNTGLQRMQLVPVKDMRLLNLYFPTPSLRQQYKTNPGGYFSHLLGHEGTGSLLSELKRREWCSYLSAGAQLSVENFGFFKITTDLTVKGMDHVDEIAEMVFQYIDLLKENKTQEWIFNEITQLRNLMFDFKDKENPLGFVTGLSGEMHDLPFQDILKVMSNSAAEDYQPELIDKLFDYLTPDNVRVQVSSHTFEDVATQEEKWYKTKHVITKVADETAQTWKAAKFSDQASLTLPQPNPFIPTDLELCTRDTLSQEKSHPMVLLDTPLMRLWYKQDDEFLLPKSYLKVRVTSPIAYFNPEHANYNHLLTQLFADYTNEEFYPATMAGLGLGMRCIQYGVSFTISGYHDKQGELLTRVLNALVNFKVDPDRFEIFKENYERSLKNHKRDQPYSHAGYFNYVALGKCWTKAEMLQALDGAKASDVQDYIGRLFKNVYVESLMCGNLTPDKALQYADSVKQILTNNFGSKPLFESEKPVDREFMLPENANYFHKVVNEVHSATCIESYYQVGLQSCTRTNVTLDLYAKLINEPAHDTLRTQEQLGYIVWSGPRRDCGVQGIRVLVQGSKHPAYLDERIEMFLAAMRKNIEDMPEEEFESARAAVIAKKLEKPKKLSARVERYWGQIVSGRYHFSKLEEDCEVLKTVTRAQVLEFHDKYVSRDSQVRRKLSCYVVPANETQIKPTEESEITLPRAEGVDDVTRMKAGLPLFPTLPPNKEPAEFRRNDVP